MENNIIEIISNIFRVAKTDVNNQSSPDSLENWDSLAHMDLVSALEEEFEIRFSDEEILEMLNVELIIEIVKSKTS